MTQFRKSIAVFVLTFATLAFSSCDNEILQTLSESDAAEVIEAALQENAGGLTANIQDVVKQVVDAVNSGAICDTIYSDTIQKSHQGNQIQASYNSDYTLEFTCNAFDNPQTAAFSMTTASEYTTSRIESDDNGSFTGTVSGLQLAAATVTLDGNYTRTGTQDLNFSTQKSINSTLTVTLTSIDVNKFNQSITGGNATFSLSGSTPDESFSFNGSIVFNGNKTATATINGTTYTLDWN